MRKLWKGVLLGGAVGAGVRLVQDVRGDEAHDELGFRVGKAATEVGYDQTAMVTRVAGAPGDYIVAAGLDDGRVWVCDVRAEKKELIKPEKGPPITALALSPDGKRIAYGDEAGGAAVVDVPAL